MATQIQSRVYQFGKDAVWQAVSRTGAELGWIVKNGSEMGDFVQLKSKASVLCPFGVLLDIKIICNSPSQTEVRVDAKSQGQMIDYGQSKRETNKFFERLEPNLCFTGTTCAITDAGATCVNCGALREPGTRFCTSCGVELPGE